MAAGTSAIVKTIQQRSMIPKTHTHGVQSISILELNDVKKLVFQFFYSAHSVSNRMSLSTFDSDAALSRVAQNLFFFFCRRFSQVRDPTLQKGGD